jgi:hypothetical protein
MSNAGSGQARHHNRFITGKIKPQIPRAGVQGIQSLQTEILHLEDIQSSISAEDPNSTEFAPLFADSFINLACIFHGVML